MLISDFQQFLQFLHLKKFINLKSEYHYLFLFSSYLAIVEKLVSSGSEIEAKNKNGDTPIIAAQRAEHQDVVQFLISKIPIIIPSPTTVKTTKE